MRAELLHSKTLLHAGKKEIDKNKYLACALFDKQQGMKGLKLGCMPESFSPQLLAKTVVY